MLLRVCHKERYHEARGRTWPGPGQALSWLRLAWSVFPSATPLWASVVLYSFAPAICWHQVNPTQLCCCKGAKNFRKQLEDAYVTNKDTGNKLYGDVFLPLELGDLKKKNPQRCEIKQLLSKGVKVSALTPAPPWFPTCSFPSFPLWPWIELQVLGCSLSRAESLGSEGSPLSAGLCTEPWAAHHSSM